MILIAPTAFKGTLSAEAAAFAMGRGVARALPEEDVRVMPLSDGGPGLLEAVGPVLSATESAARVHGPLGELVRARFRWGPGLALVESAEACGLHLIPENRLDPMAASTGGVGELIRAAVDAARVGSRSVHLVLGLGGSGTVDGGLGMAAALGWRLLDDAGRPIPPGGRGLEALAALRPPEDDWSRPERVTVLADVDAPLVGPRGAARVFGPQKGAKPAEVERLDAGLDRMAALLKRELGVELSERAGAGAAGGLGAAAVAFLDGELRAGSVWVMDTLGFDASLERARLVLTGEGAVDAQTSMGKLVGRVMASAARVGVPVLVVAGRIEGALPEGARGVDGGGAVLDEDALADLTEEAVRTLPSAGGIA